MRSTYGVIGLLIILLVVAALMMQRFIYPVGLGSGYLKEDVKMQKIIDGFSCAGKVSYDSAIRVDLFDGNGKLSKQYSIIGKNIKQGTINNYDFYVATGDYYLKDFEAGNYCETFKKIRQNQDYLISRGTVLPAVAKARGAAALDCAKKLCGIE